MSLHPNIKSCSHIKITGVRCGSPALRGEQFCYFHKRMLDSVNFPASRIHHAALLEDAESIQASIMEVVNGLIRGTIELRRGELILRALNTAVRNIRRVRFQAPARDIVREVPDFEPNTDQAALPAKSSTKEAAVSPSLEEIRARISSTVAAASNPPSAQHPQAVCADATGGWDAGAPLSSRSVRQGGGVASSGRQAVAGRRGAAGSVIQHTEPAAQRKPPANVKEPEATQRRKATAGAGA